MSRTRVLLVDMPSASIYMPSLALGLLKAELQREGMACEVLYLNVLFALDENHDATLAGMHIRDLVLSALGVRGDAQQVLREGGIHAARQGTVLDIIRRRAGEPGLNPVDVARQSDISVRYLHQLLERPGRHSHSTCANSGCTGRWPSCAARSAG